MGTILGLLSNPLASEFSSTKYLKAGGEIFAILLAVCWALTFIYHPEQIEDNPLKRRMGYNNVCVGLDEPPARYLAQFLWPVSIYMNMRFAWLEVVAESSLDDKNSSRAAKLITYFASFIFVVSVLGQTFLLVFPPVAGDFFQTWLHSSFFIQYIFIRLLVIAVLFFRNKLDGTTEDYDSITSGQWTWFFLFAATSTILPLITFIDFYWYDYVRSPGEEGPFLPWYLCFTFDMTWFFTLATTAFFLPAERPYKVANLQKQIISHAEA